MGTSVPVLTIPKVMRASSREKHEMAEEVWVTDRPVTDGPGKYNVVGIAKGRSFVRQIAIAERDEAMQIVALRRAARNVLALHEGAPDAVGNWDAAFEEIRKALV
jgi:hypothetical protein